MHLHWAGAGNPAGILQAGVEIPHQKPKGNKSREDNSNWNRQKDGFRQGKADQEYSWITEIEIWADE